MRPDMPHISHQRATTGAKFENLCLFWPAGNVVNMGEIDPAHFTKKPRYFGCGGKIASGTDWILPAVIPMLRVPQNDLHKVTDRQRPALCNSIHQNRLNSLACCRYRRAVL